MSRVAIPALVVLVAIATLLGAARWNASAQPEQVITLTERELSLPFRPPSMDDDPALQLQIQFQGRFDPLDARNWISDSRLREIGFSLHIPVGSPQAVHIYDHVPARVGWVVFEYDGPAWREIERRRELQPEHLRGPVFASRLVPVDAGAAYERLRARYPSGHLILRAVIGVSYVAAERGGPLLHGSLQHTVPAQVAVPYQFRGLLDQLGETNLGLGEPRYDVDLAVGRLGLPYIRSVRLRQ